MTGHVHFAIDRLLASKLLTEYPDASGTWHGARFRLNDQVVEELLEKNGLTEMIDRIDAN
jgi:hypothetical protein